MGLGAAGAGAGVFKNNPPRFSDVVGRDKCQSTAGGGFCKKLPQIASFAQKVKFLKRVYSRFWVKQEVLVWSEELPAPSPLLPGCSVGGNVLEASRKKGSGNGIEKVSSSPAVEPLRRGAEGSQLLEAGA